MTEIPATMTAAVLSAFGGPENLTAQTRPVPSPRRGEVLVQVHAASVNPIDYKVRRNGPAMAPALPGVLGCDMAGVVVALGDGVTGFAVGDRVFGSPGGVKTVDGTNAEYVRADARVLARMPSGLGFREAAALPLVSITAWEGLIDRARVEPGERVLIHGGAGGVGHVAIQIAKAAGAHVTATISSPEKARIARELGADETVNYRDETVEAYVARLTAGRGFDVVMDATGGSDLATSFAGARLNGRVVTIVSQYPADLTPMHGKGLSLHVVFMIIPILHDIGREHHGRIMNRVAALVEAGRLRPRLDPARFSLAQAGAAQAHLEEGGATGKVVIDVKANEAV
ncbi:zinc-dependent alcohol dehydrogenase family protein [Tistrella bauzanensis]|nr:zinc-dependent alcohol dehydrogenase family protein [Tistrella bauzanensis]